MTAPTADPQFASAAPVSLNVKRTSTCSSEADGVQPVFDLQWQFLDTAHADGWHDAAVLAQIDGSKSPGGVDVPLSAFAPFTARGKFNQWRVRARVSGFSAAPWTDWTAFYLG